MDTKKAVLVFTAVISLVTLAMSLLFLYEAFELPGDRFALLKDAFDLAVSKVLLPMFTTLVLLP